MRLKKSYVIPTLALVCAGLLAADLVTRGGIVRAAGATPAALTIPSPVQLSTSFTKIAKGAEPSVVQILSTIKEKQQPAMRWFFNGNPFGGENPFGFSNPFQGQQPQTQRAMALGSGFIVDPSGYILTNNHVVENATRIQVKLPNDHTEYNAKLVGTDPELDLAVLKVDIGKTLPALHLGNSDAMETGDWVVAIGSPFGLDQTMTAGIISAKGRDLNDPGHEMQRFLQTDAAINRGNSGGPLLNLDGQVIGINTMIASGSGNFEGVGFALPSNLAVSSYNQIIKHGKVSRGAIGVQFARESNAALLKAYGASTGVFVQQVTPGGPAANAGVRASDVITGVNSESITDGQQLVNIIASTAPGATVQMHILRDGKAMTLPVKIGDRDAIVNNDNGGSSEQPQGEATTPRLGVSLENLTPADRQQMGLTTGSVVIGSVQPGSFAEDIGLAKGDVILEVNRQHVNSADDVRNAMQSAKPGEAIAFKIMRNDGQNWNTLFAAGTLPAK
ncbi:MAG TPA: Do family serine endopeptidase [Bryobacteraceae bacterium]|nr:Do family serine endopeptidase [Bryobacteraceae bacterium]